MSWLRSTINKVREKGEALKHSEAIHRLQERTTTAVSNAAQQVRKAKDAVKAGRSGSGSVSCAEALASQLEFKAKSGYTCVAVADLFRTWIQQIQNSKERYQTEDGDIIIGFKEVLLRSRAIEITIETIAADATLRTAFVEPPAAGDTTSPGALLYELLSKTLACPVGLWFTILKSAIGDDGVLCDTHVAWLVGVVGAMKTDWYQEHLYSERRDLALRAEFLRQELKQCEAATSAEASTDEQQLRRIALSTELLQSYQAVRQNLEAAQTRRQQLLATRESDLTLISDQIKAHVVGLQSTAQAATEKQTTLEGELKQSSDSIQVQLQSMTDKRNVIDRELEALEERKQTLRRELDEVSRQLDETRSRQRQYMEVHDEQRRGLDILKTDFKDKIDKEEAAATAAEREQTVVTRVQQIVADTDSAVQEKLGAQLSELGQKQAHFAEHFESLLSEHLSYAKDQAASLRVKAEAAEVEEAVYKAATTAHEAFQAFQRDFGGMLVGDAAAIAESVKAEHAAVLEILESRRPPSATESADRVATDPAAVIPQETTTPAASPVAPEAEASPKATESVAVATAQVAPALGAEAAVAPAVVEPPPSAASAPQPPPEVAEAALTAPAVPAAPIQTVQQSAAATAAAVPALVPGVAAPTASAAVSSPTTPPEQPATAAAPAVAVPPATAAAAQPPQAPATMGVASLAPTTAMTPAPGVTPPAAAPATVPPATPVAAAGPSVQAATMSPAGPAVPPAAVAVPAVDVAPAAAAPTASPPPPGAEAAGGAPVAPVAAGSVKARIAAMASAAAPQASPAATQATTPLLSSGGGAAGGYP